MKKILSLLVLLCAGVFAIPEGLAHPPLPSEKRREVAKKLYGKIKVVKNAWDADFRVCDVKDIRDADLCAFVYEESAALVPGVGRWYYFKPTDWFSWDFSICFVKNMSDADVCVHFVKQVSDAGLR